MVDRGGEFSFIQGLHEIWQAGTSTGIHSSDTNQAGAGDVIM